MQESAHLTKKTMETHRWLKADSSLTLYADFNDPERLAAADELWAWVLKFLESVERRLSLLIPSSEVARFNAASSGSSVPVSPDTAELVGLALGMSAETGGAYNPATRMLTDLWGFSPRTFDKGYAPSRPYDRPLDEKGRIPVPQERYVDLMLKTCSLEGIEVGRANGRPDVSRGSVQVEDGDAVYRPEIDLGGIAKGWVADKVLAMAERCGFEYACYSCESSIAASKSASALALQRGDGRYTVKVGRPRRKRGVPDVAQFRMRGRRSATSGDYGRCYELDGVLYSHIINPLTGLPMNVTREMAFGGERHQSGLCSVTAIGPSAARADALATALCLMGPEGAASYYNERLRDRGWDIVALEYDNARPGWLGVMTSLPEGELDLLDDEAEIISSLGADGAVAL